MACLTCDGLKRIRCTDCAGTRELTEPLRPCDRCKIDGRSTGWIDCACRALVSATPTTLRKKKYTLCDHGFKPRNCLLGCAEAPAPGASPAEEPAKPPVDAKERVRVPKNKGSEEWQRMNRRRNDPPEPEAQVEPRIGQGRHCRRCRGIHVAAVLTCPCYGESVD